MEARICSSRECPAICTLGLLHLEHPALHRILRELGGAHRVGVAALDLVAHLVEARRVARRGDLTHRPQRRTHLLLHLGLLELGQQLGALGDLLLQHHRVLLDRLLGLPGGLQRLVVQTLEVLDALLGGDQLCGERLGGVVVLGGLGGIARCGGLIGQRQRLAHVDLQLLDVGQLTVEPHLELTLVPDHLCGLLCQRLMLALGLLDGLLDLHLRIGVLVDLRAEQRHEVLPRLDERIGHWFTSAFVSLCVLTANLSVPRRSPHPCGCFPRRARASGLRPPPSRRPAG